MVNNQPSTVISEEMPISFSIKIRSQAANIEEEPTEADDSDSDDSDIDDDDDGISPAQAAELQVELLFTLPPLYPDEKPSVEVLNTQNLSQEELAELLASLSEASEESLGTVMIFNLVSDTVEWLISKTELHNKPVIDEDAERKQKEAAAEEARKFEGTPVTKQTFIAWKAKFDAEMLKLKLEQQKKLQSTDGQNTVTTGGGRLTGREMFESDKTLAESDLNFVEDLDQNQLEALMQNIEEMELEEEDLDDEDLDDEDFGSDDEDITTDEDS